VQRDFLSDAPYGVPGTTEILPALRQTVSAFCAAGRPVVHVVRLYEEGGGNAGLVRRQLLESGVRTAAPGSPCSEPADGLLPEGCPPLIPLCFCRAGRSGWASMATRSSSPAGAPSTAPAWKTCCMNRSDLGHRIGDALPHPGRVPRHLTRAARDMWLRHRHPDHIEYCRAVMRSDIRADPDAAVGSHSRERWLALG